MNVKIVVLLGLLLTYRYAEGVVLGGRAAPSSADGSWAFAITVHSMAIRQVASFTECFMSGFRSCCCREDLESAKRNATTDAGMNRSPRDDYNWRAAASWRRTESRRSDAGLGLEVWGFLEDFGFL